MSASVFSPWASSGVAGPDFSCNSCPDSVANRTGLIVLLPSSRGTQRFFKGEDTAALDVQMMENLQSGKAHRPNLPAPVALRSLL